MPCIYPLSEKQPKEDEVDFYLTYQIPPTPLLFMLSATTSLPLMTRKTGICSHSG